MGDLSRTMRYNFASSSNSFTLTYFFLTDYHVDSGDQGQFLKPLKKRNRLSRRKIISIESPSAKSSAKTPPNKAKDDSTCEVTFDLHFDLDSSGKKKKFHHYKILSISLSSAIKETSASSFSFLPQMKNGVIQTSR